jgi:hypothetical protein
MKTNATFLEVICDYYSMSRQAGHTMAMLKGAEQTDAIILAANRDHAAYLTRLVDNPSKTIVIIPLTTPDELRERLRGYRRPLVIDNFTMFLIQKDVVRIVKKAAAARGKDD